MCRNIKQLYNFEPRATSDEVKAATMQYVRKISGFQTPSAVNAAAFQRAIDEISRASNALINNMVTQAEPRSREIEAAKARAHSAKRYGV